MNKTLIVLNDTILLSVFKSWVFRSQKKDFLFLAKNAKEAIEIMQSQTIDLLATELPLPEIDGLELLGGFSFYYPSLKVAILIPTLPDVIEKRLERLSSFYFVNRPNALKDFINLTSLLDVAIFQSKPLAELAIADFFELIEIQKKTCLLAIETAENKKKALVYFENGILYDAVYENVKAELAVIEMLDWKHVKITFKSIEAKKFRKQIQTKLTTLIVEGTKSKAENGSKTEFDSILLDSLLDDVLAKADTMIEEKAEAAAKAEIEAKVEAEAKAKMEAEAAAKVEVEAKAKELAAINAMADRINQLPLIELLKPLQELDNYLAAVIFDMTGRVLVEHNDSTYNIESIGENAVVVIKTAIETINNIGLGISNFIQINCNECIFEAVWVLENQFVSAILLKPIAQNTGMAKIHLIKLSETIHNQLI